MMFLNNNIEIVRSKLNRYQDQLIPLILVLFYAAEAFSKIMKQTTGDFSLLPRVIKSVIICFFFITIIIIKTKPFIKYIFSLAMIFSIAQFFLPDSFSANAIVTLGRYLYPLALFILFTQRKKIDYKRTFSFFENLMVFNSALILIGFLFQIKIFETYEYLRFGYNGLFITSSSSTYVYIITLFYFLFSSNKFLNWKKAVILLSCLLIGTKSLYLAMILISGYLIFNYIKPKYRFWSTFLFLVFAAFAGYFFFFHFGKFNTIRLNKGLLSSILSYRNELLLTDTIPFIKENWSFVNYLFGGVSDMQTRSEMGIIDVFYFWGILGGCYYLYAFYKTYFTFKLDRLVILLMVILFIIISLAGNFFFYSSIPIYLLILKEKIINRQQNAY